VGRIGYTLDHKINQSEYGTQRTYHFHFSNSSYVKGKLLHILSAHAHWVNTMSLSTDFVIRTGAFDHTGKIPVTFEEGTKKALDRYRKARRGAGGDAERLISGSDDFTMFLWEPEKSTKPIGRLTGIPRFLRVLI
jgi:hypothetical protein